MEEPTAAPDAQATRLPKTIKDHTLVSQQIIWRATAMAQAKTLSTEDMKRVLAYISTRPHAQRNRAMLLLTAWAGLRVGEVAALRVGDVRAADGTVKSEMHLAADRVKHAHARTVLLTIAQN